MGKPMPSETLITWLRDAPYSKNFKPACAAV
jgi:hypothetical protein